MGGKKRARLPWTKKRYGSERIGRADETPAGWGATFYMAAAGSFKPERTKKPDATGRKINWRTGDLRRRFASKQLGKKGQPRMHHDWPSSRYAAATAA